MTNPTHYVGPPVGDWSTLMDTLVPGANLMIVMPKQDYYRTACEVEDEGFEIRDCISVLVPLDQEPLAVLWAIKPREGTYVDNALKHGVAGLNIDAGRLRVNKDDPNRRPNRAQHDLTYKYDEASLDFFTGTNSAPVYDEGAHSSKGRYPSNLILMHHEDCECVGTKKVKNLSGSSTGDEPSSLTDTAYGDYACRPPFQAYGDQDGFEEVEDWVCHPTCPVKRLDDQSGVLKSGSRRAGSYGVFQGVTYGETWESKLPELKGDSGGASRYFQQVHNVSDLLKYLETLAQPPVP